jgi:hypothetical protein
MADLAAWLLAQVDADEAEQTAGWVDHVNGEWHRADCERNSMSAGACDCDVPARVLAECAAKRAIVELHEEVTFADPVDGEFGCVTCGPGDRPCPTLTHLAQPYRDREGWREEWATTSP